MALKTLNFREFVVRNGGSQRAYREFDILVKLSEEEFNGSVGFGKDSALCMIDHTVQRVNNFVAEWSSYGLMAVPDDDKDQVLRVVLLANAELVKWALTRRKIEKGSLDNLTNAQ